MSFGVDPRNPLEYARINYFLVPGVSYNREPISGVGGDYDFQVETIWRVSKAPNGDPPITGNEGDQWILTKKTGGYAQGNQNPTWQRFIPGGSPSLFTLSDDANATVSPSGPGDTPPNNIQLYSPLGTLDIVSDAPGNKIALDLTGGEIGISKVQTQQAAAPGTNPVESDGTGLITVSGATVAAGTTPVQAITRALSAYNIEVQLSQDAASTAANKVGLVAFYNGQFAVDVNGFAKLRGGDNPAILGIVPDLATAPGTSPVISTSGNITMTGAQVATGVIGANAIRIHSLAANALTVEIQQSTTSAAKDTTKNGIAHFRSDHFTCSEGFVSLPAPSAFSAYLSVTSANATGDGTPYVVICDSTTTTVAAYDTATGVYTAPSDGLYQFNFTICLESLDVTFTGARLIFSVTNAGGVAQQLVGFSEINPGAAFSSSNQFQASGAALVPMTAGWKAYLSAIVSGGTKTVGAKGGAVVSEPKCSFSGYCVSIT